MRPQGGGSLKVTIWANVNDRYATQDYQ